MIFDHPPVNQGITLVVMGVSGCGKSTVAFYLAQQLDAHFKDGDELHPEANIKRMSQGIALTDDDRWPWLYSVRDYARRHAAEHGVCVIACSALKRRYREVLNDAGPVLYVFLDGSRELIASRMHQRTGHFMPESLLDSQFAALEIPDNREAFVRVDITPGPTVIAGRAAEQVRSHPSYADHNHQDSSS